MPQTKQTQTTLSEINMVPFIDVVLVLLIIFMITAPILQSGIEVAVPKTKTVHEITEQHLVVTVDKDQCLLIYPLPDWEDIERKLTKLPTLDPRTRGLQRLMVGYATDLELDGHGRLLLPANLRVCLELQKKNPDHARIAALTNHYFLAVALQGAMQMVTIFVMARFATGI